VIALGTLPAALVLALVVRSPEAGPRAVPETCPGCHAKLGGRKALPALLVAEDVHAKPGLGCAGCHGGDPTQRGQYQAMNSEKGFNRLSYPQDALRVCGGCHADGPFVRRYAPHLPTDQRAMLLASRHAPRYARGGREAAVCTSCHGAHGIFSPRDPRSTVHPTRVAERCATCHAHPEEPGPVERFAGSVHQLALARGDASSATCPSCHGSHDAYTPRAQSVANVCGKCHPRNAELFRASAHQASLEARRPGGCSGCHDSHATARTSDAWVSLAVGAVCQRCHSRAGDRARAATAAMAAALADAAALQRQAEEGVAAIRARGMLIVDGEAALEESRQELVQARTVVHSASASAVAARAGAASTAARAALQAVSGAGTELRYRRRGLLVALLFVLGTIAALVLQIRSLERARLPHPVAAEPAVEPSTGPGATSAPDPRGTVT
jgi:predicted CXXCH cytochrome family protein